MATAERKNWARPLYSAAALTALGLVLKTMSIGFKIYLSGIIGSQGMGLYQLVFSLFGFAATLAMSGAQLGVTQLCAAAIARRQFSTLPRVLRRAGLYALSLGCLTGLGGWALAPRLGALLGNNQTVFPFRLLALGLPFLALSACLQGYFFAGSKIVQGTLANVVKRLCKMGLTALLFSLHPPAGAAEAVATACFASTCGEVGGCLYLGALYWRGRRDLPPDRGPAWDGGSLGLAFLRICIPVALCSYLQSGFNTLENTLVPQGLQQSGTSAELALSQYGVLGGMVLPLLSYPGALLASFSMLLIPVVVKLHTLQNTRKLEELIVAVVRLTLLFSCFVTGVFLVFSDSLAAIFPTGEGVSAFLQALAPLVPVLFLDHAVDCVLKGMGEQNRLLWHNIADMALTAALLVLLLPRFGIRGYIVTLYLPSALNTGLGLWLLCRRTEVVPRWGLWVVRPLAAALLGCAGARLLLGPLLAGGASPGQLPAAIGSSLALFLPLCRLSGCAKKADWQTLRRLLGKPERPPKGRAK